MEGYADGTLTCLTADYIKRNVNTDFPLILNIEPTNACNLNCYVCPRNKSGRPVGYMDFDLFKKIIGECKTHKRLNMINFHKDGESLLHPRIYEMIRYARQARVANVLHMNTNGLPLDKSNARELLLSGIDDVTISIDAARDETFKKIKGAALLKKVESNVEGLFSMRRQLALERPFVRVKIMEFEDTKGREVEEFLDRWRGVADDIQVTGVHNWSGGIRDLAVTDEVEKKRFPCNLLWYALAINWDGRVSTCCIDWDLSALVGDARLETIHQIWNGRRIKELRKAELCGNHNLAKVCMECTLWSGGEDLTDWFSAKKEFYV
jgi:hypothetical protein